MEVTSLGALGILLLFDILSWQEAISGFSNPAVITIGAIFIMSRALVKTGFLEVFADFLIHKTGNQKWLTIFIFLFSLAETEVYAQKKIRSMRKADEAFSLEKYSDERKPVILKPCDHKCFCNNCILASDTSSTCI